MPCHMRTILRNITVSIDRVDAAEVFHVHIEHGRGEHEPDTVVAFLAVNGHFASDSTIRFGFDS